MSPRANLRAGSATREVLHARSVITSGRKGLHRRSFGGTNYEGLHMGDVMHFRPRSELGFGGLGVDGLGSLRETVSLPPEGGLNPIRNPLRQLVGPLVYRLVSDPDFIGGGRDGPTKEVDGFKLEHASLNHSSGLRATIVLDAAARCGTVSTMVEFKDRLAAAMKAAHVTEHGLADELGITYQGVKKLLTGKSKEFSATNNFRAARFLGVDSDWLASGEGVMKRDDAWPFPLVDRDRFDTLDPERRGYVQRAISQALEECEERSETTSGHKPAGARPAVKRVTFLGRNLSGGRGDASKDKKGGAA